ncbi:MAG: hypothetical protein AAGA93_01905 [Actinomycetota bacterium]
MARSLLDLHDADDGGTIDDRENRVGRLAAAALAAAVSALIIGSLVVTFSDRALGPDGTVAAATVTSGTISLVDDDQGRSLFDLADMAPGRPVVHCIELVYDGTIVPVDLAMRAEASGDLTRFLDVAVESGKGGGFDDCSGFESTGQVYGGTLAELAASGWLDLGTLVNAGQRSSYRISFELQDRQEALGRAANASFVWEVTPT